MHGRRALFDAAVVLLNPLVERAVAAVDHFMSQDFANRTRRGIMPIDPHPFWGVTGDVKRLLEKALGLLPISLLAQQRIHQMAIVING